MSPKLHHRRSTKVAVHLLFSAVLLATASNVQAEYTYSIVNYPQTPDLVQGTCIYSGTIVTDKNNGVLTWDDISSFNIAITEIYDGTTLDYGFSGSSSSVLICDGVSATPTQLTINSDLLTTGGRLLLGGSAPADESNPWAVDTYWINDPGSGLQPMFLIAAYPGINLFKDYPQLGSASVPDVSLGTTPMIIATSTTTPEPCTLVLLAIGAISLLAYAWRRRKRTA